MLMLLFRWIYFTLSRTEDFPRIKGYWRKFLPRHHFVWKQKILQKRDVFFGLFVSLLPSTRVSSRSQYKHNECQTSFNKCWVLNMKLSCSKFYVVNFQGLQWNHKKERADDIIKLNNNEFKFEQTPPKSLNSDLFTMFVVWLIYVFSAFCYQHFSLFPRE